MIRPGGASYEYEVCMAGELTQQCYAPPGFTFIWFQTLGPLPFRKPPDFGYLLRPGVAYVLRPNTVSKLWASAGAC